MQTHEQGEDNNDGNGNSEQKVPSAEPAKNTTAYIGGISQCLKDDTLRALFSSCGSPFTWTRIHDATNTPKSFGFCEFESVGALRRALLILSGLPLPGGRALVVSVDDDTREYVEASERALLKKGIDPREDAYEGNVVCVEECIRILKTLGMYFSVQFLEKKLKDLSTQHPATNGKEEQGGHDSASSRHRPKGHEDDGDGYGRSGGKRLAGKEEHNRHNSAPSKTTTREEKRFEMELRERQSKWSQRQLSIFQRHERALKDTQMAREFKQELSEKQLNEYRGLADGRLMLQSLKQRLLGGVADNDDLAPKRGKGAGEQDREKAKAKDKESAVEDPETVLLFYRDRKQWRQNYDLQSRREIDFDSKNHIDPPDFSPLLPNDFTLAALLQNTCTPSGEHRTVDENEVIKLYQGHKPKRIKSLIERIPTTTAALFSHPIHWPTYTRQAMRPHTHKTISKLTTSQANRLTEAVLDMLDEQSCAKDVVAFLIDDGYLFPATADGEGQEEEEEAERVVAIIWRYLVYETMAVLYEI